MYKHDVPSACSCFLTAGQWGSGGYHHRIPTDLELYCRELNRRINEDRELAALVRAWRAAEHGSDRWHQLNDKLEIIREEARAFVRPYVGRPETFGRCGAARAVDAQRIAARKADRRSGDYGDELL